MEHRCRQGGSDVPSVSLRVRDCHRGEASGACPGAGQLRAADLRAGREPDGRPPHPGLPGHAAVPARRGRRLRRWMAGIRGRAAALAGASGFSCPAAGTDDPGAGSHLRRDQRIMECRSARAQAGGRMNRIRRRVGAAVNPASTAVTRWWCHSGMRHMLTGHGPTARQRRLIRHGTPGIRRGTPGTGFTPSAEQMAEQMKARARAIDDLLSRDDHEM